ncbi:MAG TPA: uroporphyrinogen decarboxylase family protein [Opitutus sp.]|nr:uroporphyrinogen decarboxylase family protein [Opitutus sp.]
MPPPPSPAHAPATRAEVESVLRCAAPRPVPLFLPAIYEHKAWFIGSTPSAISRDANLLTRAMLAEFEAIGPDALAIGVDVYNLEAEAVGCTVTFYDGADTSIPGIKPGNHIVHVGDDLSNARLPNPLKDGRMPVNLAAARAVRAAVGDNYWLRGAVSGPFSLAISLVGAEALFVASLDEPEWVHSVLAYAGRIIKEFSKAYIDAGVELIVFDSQASPELLSPAMYEEFVLPVTTEFTAWAATQGVRDVPLIIGGNTTPIAEIQTRTGANNLLCDFTADFDEWSAICRSAGRSMRRNISPRLIETSTPDEIYAVARREVERGRDIPGFIMGTAVIPFGTPTENVLAVKRACLDAAKS